MQNKNLLCSLCNKEFNRVGQNPMLLKCEHTVCEKCLKNMDPYKCPDCKTDFDPQSVTKDSNLLNLKVNLKTELCSKHSTIKDAFCLKCAQSICSRCKKDDHKSHGESSSLEEILKRFQLTNSEFNKNESEVMSYFGLKNMLHQKKLEFMKSRVKEYFHTISKMVTDLEETALKDLETKFEKEDLSPEMTILIKDLEQNYIKIKEESEICKNQSDAVKFLGFENSFKEFEKNFNTSKEKISSEINSSRLKINEVKLPNIPEVEKLMLKLKKIEFLNFLHPHCKKNDRMTANLDGSVDSFEVLNLKHDLIRGIYGEGLIKPSVVQSKGILSILNLRDTIIQAGPESGKTVTYAISALQMIDEKSSDFQALIIAPIREVAETIQRVIMSLGEYLNIGVNLSVGGVYTSEQKKKIKEGSHIVVGTPGKVYDMLKKGFLKADYLKLLVLDETDEILRREFENIIKDLIKFMPGDIQIALFSSTMTPDLLNFTTYFMREPATILDMQSEVEIFNGIKQFYIAIDKDEWKFDTFVEFYTNIDIEKTIIYCKNQRINDLSTRLKEMNFEVTSIDSSAQDERNVIISKFINGSSKILITSDLLGRCRNYSELQLVINYDLPVSNDLYCIRVDNRSRCSRKRVVVNFVTPRDVKFIQELEKSYKFEMCEMPLDVKCLDLFNFKLTNIFD